MRTGGPEQGGGAGQGLWGGDMPLSSLSWRDCYLKIQLAQVSGSPHGNVYRRGGAGRGRPQRGTGKITWVLPGMGQLPNKPSAPQGSELCLLLHDCASARRTGLALSRVRARGRRQGERGQKQRHEVAGWRREQVCSLRPVERTLKESITAFVGRAV